MPPIRLVAVFAALLILAACGQSGDLYLPDEKPPADAAPAADVPAADSPPSADPKKDTK